MLLRFASIPALVSLLSGTAAAACLDIDALRLCGDWQDTLGGQTISGDLRVKAASGRFDFDLIDAELTYGDAGVQGQASFPLPAVEAVGVGAGGVVRGDVRVLRAAAEAQTIDLGTVSIPIEAGSAALVIDYEAGVDGYLGGVDIAAGRDGALVLVPDSKTFYLGGDFLGLPVGAIELAALGVSLNGALSWNGETEVFDGADWTAPTVDAGHLYLAGNLPIGGYPVSIDGELILDVVGDDQLPWQAAGQGEATLGYSVGVFDLSIPVGEGAFQILGGDDGALMLAGRAHAPRWLERTPLAFLEDARNVEVYGYFDLEGGALDDFVIGLEASQSTLAGLNAQAVVVELTPDGIEVTATVTTALGAVEVVGSVDADGGFELSGSAEFSVLGQTLQGTLTVGPDGATLAGDLQTGVGTVSVTGGVSATQFELTGVATLNVNGFELVDAEVTASLAGIGISTRLEVPGFAVEMRGFVAPTLILSAVVEAQIGGMSLGSTSITFDGATLALRTTYTFAGRSFTIAGTMQANGAMLADGSLPVSARKTVLGIGVSVSGSVVLTFDKNATGQTRRTARLTGATACAHYLIGDSCAAVPGTVTVNRHGKVTVEVGDLGQVTFDVL